MKRLPNEYFDKVYAEGDDPWGFETRDYEKRKYALTLAALPKPRYRSAFEPGCASGVLTEALAARCDRVVAMEPIERIANRARERLVHVPNVHVVTGALPESWPVEMPPQDEGGAFDLFLASEVLYYLTNDALLGVLDRVAEALDRNGHLVAVHYRLETDYPMRGDDVHAVIESHPRFVTKAQYLERDFRMTIAERAP